MLAVDSDIHIHHVAISDTIEIDVHVARQPNRFGAPAGFVNASHLGSQLTKLQKRKLYFSYWKDTEDYAGCLKAVCHARDVAENDVVHIAKKRTTWIDKDLVLPYIQWALPSHEADVRKVGQSWRASLAPQSSAVAVVPDRPSVVTSLINAPPVSAPSQALVPVSNSSQTVTASLFYELQSLSELQRTPLLLQLFNIQLDLAKTEAEAKKDITRAEAEARISHAARVAEAEANSKVDEANSKGEAAKALVAAAIAASKADVADAEVRKRKADKELENLDKPALPQEKKAEVAAQPVVSPKPPVPVPLTSEEEAQRKKDDEKYEADTAITTTRGRLKRIKLSQDSKNGEEAPARVPTPPVPVQAPTVRFAPTVSRTTTCRFSSVIKETEQERIRISQIADEMGIRYNSEDCIKVGAIAARMYKALYGRGPEKAAGMNGNPVNIYYRKHTDILRRAWQEYKAR